MKNSLIEYEYFCSDCKVNFTVEDSFSYSSPYCPRCGSCEHTKLIEERITIDDVLEAEYDNIMESE